MMHVILVAYRPCEQHGDTRLVWFANNLVVESCYGGVWLKACGLHWSNREATVMCKQTGIGQLGKVGH